MTVVLIPSLCDLEIVDANLFIKIIKALSLQKIANYLSRCAVAFNCPSRSQSCTAVSRGAIKKKYGKNWAISISENVDEEKSSNT